VRVDAAGAAFNQYNYGVPVPADAMPTSVDGALGAVRACASGCGGGSGSSVRAISGWVPGLACWLAGWVVGGFMGIGSACLIDSSTWC